MNKHPMPPFLEQAVTAAVYERWLLRKAVAHVKRDRGRGRQCAVGLYKDLIHDAVVRSGGNDSYTGEPLDWALISTYRNEESKLGRHVYRAGRRLLPTVDHVTADPSQGEFRICGARTNDAKNDLTPAEFLELCAKVLAHAGYSVVGPVSEGNRREAALTRSSHS